MEGMFSSIREDLAETGQRARASNPRLVGDPASEAQRLGFLEGNLGETGHWDVVSSNLGNLGCDATFREGFSHPQDPRVVARAKGLAVLLEK